MKTTIHAQVSWVIELEGDEQFEVTGTTEYGSREVRIRVAHVYDRPKFYRDRAWYSGIEVAGSRILKDGRFNGERKRLALTDDDPRIPHALLERIIDARIRLDALNKLIEAAK